MRELSGNEVYVMHSFPRLDYEGFVSGLLCLFKGSSAAAGSSAGLLDGWLMT